jgi:hypothetical protein
MAKPDTKITSRPKAGAKRPGSGDGLPFTRKNYMIFAVGLVAIIVGYIALAQGSITLAPILLVLGYCAIIPIAILYRDNGNSGTAQKAPGA